jgi:hypothetical protein
MPLCSPWPCEQPHRAIAIWHGSVTVVSFVYSHFHGGSGLSYSSVSFLLVHRSGLGAGQYLSRGWLGCQEQTPKIQRRKGHLCSYIKFPNETEASGGIYYVCLFTCLPVCLSTYVCVYLYSSIHLSVHLSIDPSICLCGCLSMYIPTYLPREKERERYLNNWLTWLIVGAGRSQIYRGDSQPGNVGKHWCCGPEYKLQSSRLETQKVFLGWIWRQNSLYRKPQTLFSRLSTDCTRPTHVMECHSSLSLLI